MMSIDQPFDLVALISPYLLIFARLSAALMIAPGFNETHLPIRYRLLFALALSIALKEVIALPQHVFNGPHLILILVQETIIGSFIGFIARLLISILDILGTVIGLQIGLGNAMVFNPSMGAQATVVDHFIITAGVMLFFTMDLHHIVLKSLVHSYNNFPLVETTPLHDKNAFMGTIVGSLKDLSAFFSQSFNIACQLCLPFLILGLLFQFILGLLNRVVPSIQVFFISLPLQILLGFTLMFMILGYCLHLTLNEFSQFYSQLLP